MGRVGVLYSIGFLIILVVFISFINLVIRNSNLSSARFSEDAKLEWIRNLDESIQDGFRDIFIKTSGISISRSGYDLFIGENLPNTNADAFKKNLSKYKTFIEGNYSVNFNITEINKTMHLYVKPHGIRINHSTYGGNDMKVVKSQNNFLAYKLDLTINTDAFCTSSGINTLLDIEVFDPTGSACILNDVAFLTVRDTNLNGPKIVTVDFPSISNILNITVSSGMSINLNLKIDDLSVSNDSIIVTTDQNILYFNFTDINYTKNGTIRIL